ncbi:MAG: LysR family transcriptional regulator [Myxococcota bacterium]
MSNVHDDISELRQLDLDLLVYLDVMLRRRSITRAAKEMNITQSAMSHALRRLRQRLGDPLLVRVGGKMAPSPFAERLHPPLRAALVALHRAVVRPQGFDPATAQRTFRLASPDLFDVLFLPTLIARFQEAAPGVDLDVASYGIGDLPEQLSAGELDLAIVPIMAQTPMEANEGLVRRTLFHDRFRCFFRNEHPVLSLPWSLETWIGLRHLLIAPAGRGGGVVDMVLEGHGMKRRVGLRVRSFSTAPLLVAQTDLVLTAPASMTKVTREMGIVDRAPPIPLPTHGVAMLWHRRFGQEPDLVWLREQLRGITAQAEISQAEIIQEGIIS